MVEDPKGQKKADRPNAIETIEKALQCFQNLDYSHKSSQKMFEDITWLIKYWEGIWKLLRVNESKATEKFAKAS